MAIIDVGDAVPFFPEVGDVVAGQVFKVPGLACRALTLDSGPKRDSAPSEANKSDIAALLGSRGLTVPHAFRDEKWMVSGWPIQAEVYRTLCPWGEHAGVLVTADVFYNEGISSSNYVEAPPVHLDSTWSQPGALERSPPPSTPPGDFSTPWGGGVPCSCKFRVEMVETTCGFGIRVTATLVSMPRDSLAGTPEVQVVDVTCPDFQGGVPINFFWTGVAYPAGPIGIVRSMILTLRGSQTYTD